VNAEVLKALKAPEVLAALQKLGLEPGGNSPQQFAAMIVDEGKRWRAAVKAAGIKLD
jgi:tripartite-type tricarboxylate transporter receptor subunit TctC